jgi:hypothetical protein
MNPWVIAVPLALSAGWFLYRVFERQRRIDDRRIPREKIDISYRTGQFRR